jgi:hypothetical protein
MVDFINEIETGFTPALARKEWSKHMLPTWPAYSTLEAWATILPWYFEEQENCAPVDFKEYTRTPNQENVDFDSSFFDIDLARHMINVFNSSFFGDTPYIFAVAEGSRPGEFTILGGRVEGPTQDPTQ